MSLHSWFKCLSHWILGMAGIIVGHPFDTTKVCVSLHSLSNITWYTWNDYCVMFNYDVTGSAPDAAPQQQVHGHCLRCPQHQQVRMGGYCINQDWRLVLFVLLFLHYFSKDRHWVVDFVHLFTGARLLSRNVHSIAVLRHR